MKKIVYVLFFSVFVLTACNGSTARSESQQSATLAPVPSGYAGKTNPLGADSATAGANVYHTNCEVCHGVVGYGDGPAGQALEPHPKNLAELQIVASGGVEGSVER